MTDREKVIMGLERCLEKLDTVAFITGCFVSLPLMKEIIALLKEQKPAKAKIMGESKSYGSWWFACGACGHAIDVEDKYCRECGRAVKWDD